MFKKIEEVRRNTTRSRIKETHAQIYKVEKIKFSPLISIRI